MDTELTQTIWRGMLILSIVVIPACLLAGPAGWLSLVLWVATLSSVIPEEGERRVRISPEKQREIRERHARSRADVVAQQRYLDHHFNRY